MIKKIMLLMLISSSANAQTTSAWSAHSEYSNCCMAGECWFERGNVCHSDATEHDLELLKQLAQNAMGSHPDMRPDRDHSGTLSYEDHQRKLALCMVELSTITDPELRKWCEAQSRRLP